MAIRKDLTGQRFSSLVVIRHDRHTNHGEYWLCRCDCGKEKSIRGDSLTCGATISCGCQNAKNHTKEIMIGTRFGMLTVVEKTNDRIRGQVAWKCLCDCGRTCEVNGTDLRTGNNVSCGCKRKTAIGDATRKHGMRRTRLYHEWCSMKKRCKSTVEKDREIYLDRGITYCEEWEDFITFCEWALSHGYADNLTLDRIDTNKGYSPENCRWVDMATQCRNKRSNVWVEVDGERMCMTDAANKLGIPPKWMSQKVRRYGFTFEEACAAYPNRRLRKRV